jgi:hypothetical protein
VIAERPTRRCAARHQPEPRIGASVVRGDSGITRRFQRDQTRFSEDSPRRAAEAARRRATGGSSPSYLVRWTPRRGGGEEVEAPSTASSRSWSQRPTCVIAERPTRRCAARHQPEPRIGASVVRDDSEITHGFQRAQTRFSEEPPQRAARAARRRATGGSSPTYLVRWTPSWSPPTSYGGLPWSCEEYCPQSPSFPQV